MSCESPRRMRSSIMAGTIGDYEFIGTLGKGLTSVVHLCRNKCTDETMAVKYVDKDNYGCFWAFTEEYVLKHVSHENIVKFVESFDNSSTIGLVLEYVPGIDLLQCLVVRNEVFSTQETLNVMIPLMSALSYLHSLGVCHRDVTLENIVVSNIHCNPTVKLIDFGYASTDTESQSHPPPPIQEEFFSCKVDVWDAGVVMSILLSGLPTLQTFLATRDYTVLLQHVKNPFVGVVMRILTINPNYRLGANEVLEKLCSIRGSLSCNF